MAKAVAEAGATVLLHGRDENLLKNVSTFTRVSQNAEFIFLMSANDNEVLAAFGKIREQHGKLDGLIKQCWHSTRRPITEFELEDFDRVLDTNQASWLLCREAIRTMQVKVLDVCQYCRSWAPGS